MLGTYPPPSNAETVAPGPLLLCVGALHGNEPSGVLALERVLARLQKSQPSFHGRLVALTGNRTALLREERYLEVDLNRVWSDDGKCARGSAEEAEFLELREAIDRELASADGPAALLDLHSTSADGAPFCIMGDTLHNRKIAEALEMPTILGLEETVHGTLVEYACEEGHMALCVEGGQHTAEESVDHHESAVWLALESLGMITADAVPDLKEHRRRLRRASGNVPRFLEVRHRHRIDDGERFVMEPEHKNFERVHEGDLLAHSGADLQDEVRAPLRGRLLMPLYQVKGDDGFFLVKRVSPFWLKLSALLRYIRAHRILPLFPGVTRDPERPGVVHVDRKVARWLAVKIFHLFGYRRARRDGDILEFCRRREQH